MKNKHKHEKYILGVDPGSTKIGYGVISYKNNSTKPDAVEYGYIDLKGVEKEQERLLQLYKDLKLIFKKYKFDSIAVESIYFFKNTKTFTPVVQARGVILLAASEHGVKVFEYTPLVVKQTISGYGKSDKSLIERLVKSSLDISTKIRPDDASDALAIALCHLRHLLIKP